MRREPSVGLCTILCVLPQKLAFHNNFLERLVQQLVVEVVATPFFRAAPFAARSEVGVGVGVGVDLYVTCAVILRRNNLVGESKR